MEFLSFGSQGRFTTSIPQSILGNPSRGSPGQSLLNSLGGNRLSNKTGSHRESAAHHQSQLVSADLVGEQGSFLRRERQLEKTLKPAYPERDPWSRDSWDGCL